MKSTNLSNENSEFSGTYTHVLGLEAKSCQLQDKIFSGSLLTQNIFTGVTFIGCVFFGSHLNSNIFVDCTFIDCQFQFCNMKENSFENCKFDACFWLKGSALHNEFLNCEFDEATSEYLDNRENELDDNSEFNQLGFLLKAEKIRSEGMEIAR